MDETLEQPMASERRRDEGDPLAAVELLDQPGHLLRRCQQYAVDCFVQEVGEDGLTPRQFALLLAVYQHPGSMQADLVRRTGIDRSTLGEMTRRLSDRGLIRRQRAAGDQRANALRCTAAGRQALLATLPGMYRAQARIVAALEPGTLPLFMASLTRVAAAAREGADPA